MKYDNIGKRLFSAEQTTKRKFMLTNKRRLDNKNVFKTLSSLATFQPDGGFTFHTGLHGIFCR